MAEIDYDQILAEIANEQPEVGIRFSMMDFTSFTETLEVAISPDKPKPSLGSGGVNLVINAPSTYYPSENLAAATLFFDAYERERELFEGCYQVKPTKPLSADAFDEWAHQGIRLLTHTLKHKGMVCIDLEALLGVLRQSTSRQLHMTVVPYERLEDLPREALEQYRFSTLFAALFAGADLTLGMYADLGCALEEINPDLRQLVLAVNIYSKSPCVLLLGEYDSGESYSGAGDEIWAEGDLIPAFLRRIE